MSGERFAELETAVEAHKRDGEELGALYLSNRLTATEVLDRAAELDDALYTVLDEIQIREPATPKGQDHD